MSYLIDIFSVWLFFLFSYIIISFPLLPFITYPYVREFSPINIQVPNQLLNTILL